MSTYIVTGGAGFIGSAFVRKASSRNDKIIVLDALTYSGYRQNLIEVEHKNGFEFVEGNIKDAALVAFYFQNFSLMLLLILQRSRMLIVQLSPQKSL